MPQAGSIEALKARFAAIAPAVEKALRPALIKSGNELQDRMQHFAPKDTGALAASITVTLPGQTTPPYSQPGGSRTASATQIFVTAGNSAVRYAHLPEYGTLKAAAQPYFWPSYRSLKPRITLRLKRTVVQTVKEAWTQ